MAGMMLLLSDTMKSLAGICMYSQNALRRAGRKVSGPPQRRIGA